MSVFPGLPTSRRAGDACVSDLQLDLLATGELEPGERERVTDHLDACSECAQRRDVLAAARAEFLAEPPSDVFARVQAAAQGRTQRRRVLYALALTAATAIAAGVVIVLPTSAPVSQSAGGAAHGVRTKGAEKLELVVRHPDGRVEAVVPGGTLSPDDAIRFRVSMSKDAHVAVVGMDAAGVVSVYAPQSGGTERLRAATRRALDGSVILDRTLGPERITALFCEQEVSRRELIRAGERALAEADGEPGRVAELPLPCRSASFLIQKVPRP